MTDTNVTCKDFIEVLFDGYSDDETICVTRPEGDTFYNFRIRSGEFASFMRGESEHSWYVCISTVRWRRGELVRRRRADLFATYAIVLDDIGTKVDADKIDVAPSWIMETSEGNHQYGYLLEEPIEDEAKVHAFIDCLIDKGLSDPGAKGAYRVVRVPGSVHKTGFTARVVDWSPNAFYSLEALMNRFGVDDADLDVRAKPTLDDLEGEGLEPLVNTFNGQRSLLPEDVEEILEALPDAWVDQYASWERVGKALFRLDRDDPNMKGKGLDLWEQWSARTGAYDGYACADKWHQVVDTPDMEPKPYTVGSLIKETGWKRSKEVEVYKNDNGEVVPLRYEPMDVQVRNYMNTAVAGLMYMDDFYKENDPIIWDNVLRAEPSCFIEHKGHKYFINRNGDQVPLTPDREAAILAQEFGEFIDRAVVGEYVKARVEAEDKKFSTEAKIATWTANFYKKVMVEFWAAISRGKIAVGLQLQVDMFVDDVAPNITPGKCIFSIPFAGFGAKDMYKDQECIDDYLKHNPMLIEIVDFVLMSRFASNRKNCYLWIQADSDWGKGFLFAKSGVLGALGLVQRMSIKEIEKAADGHPVGIDKYSLIHSWVLHVDEFKTINAETKMLEDEIIASPKNMLRFEAPVYAKVFTSAESVEALTGETGVEAQFAKRFNYMRFHGALSDREVFRRKGMFIYTASVRSFVQEYLEGRVQELVAMGPADSAFAAEKWLMEFHARHGIGGKFECLDDSVVEVAEEIAEAIERFCQHWLKDDVTDVRERVVYDKVMLGYPHKFNEALAQSCVKGMYGDEPCVVVNKIRNLCNEYIQHKVNRSEIKKMAYKLPDMAAQVDQILWKERPAPVTNYKDDGGKWKSSRGAVVLHKNL